MGGFESITLSGSTQATLGAGEGTAVENGVWYFDLTDRAGTLSASSLLTFADELSGEVHVDFATDAQAQGGWNLASLASVDEDTVFELNIAGETVAGVTYEEKIATGAYAGWGFTLDGGVLKFANLA